MSHESHGSSAILEKDRNERTVSDCGVSTCVKTYHRVCRNGSSLSEHTPFNLKCINQVE